MMRAPIIVNESTTPDIPGCVYIFSSLSMAERYFEAWYADESYFACDADGLPLKIVSGNQSDGAAMMVASGEPPRPDLALNFVKSYLKSILDKSGSKSLGVSEEWLTSASAEELFKESLKFATE